MQVSTGRDLKHKLGCCLSVVKHHLKRDLCYQCVSSEHLPTLWYDSCRQGRTDRHAAAADVRQHACLQLNLLWRRHKHRAVGPQRLEPQRHCSRPALLPTATPASLEARKATAASLAPIPISTPVPAPTASQSTSRHAAAPGTTWLPRHALLP